MGVPLIQKSGDSLLGAYGWDDEGVPAQSTPIVKDGLFNFTGVTA